MLIHSDKKPYQSSVSYTFTHIGNLTSHMRSHTGVKRECSVCHKRFKWNGSLGSHTQIYSDDKPYQCTVCDNQFTQRGILANHMRIHNGEKPHQCTVFDKQFAGCGNLASHMRIRSDENPYQCTVCDK